MLKKWLADANRFVLFFLLGGLLLRSIIAVWLYPGFDEAYYYLYSRNLDWSYYDHPVLVALTTGFGIWLTGTVSQFTIRIGTLILYTGSLLLLYLSAAKLFNHHVARLTLAIASVIPIFQVGFGVLTLPDSPLIFFWSASIYCAINEFFGQRKKDKNNLLPSFDDRYLPSYRLAILGVLVGLACLSKYHGFILALGLLGFCLFSRDRLSVFRSPWGWLGISLFLLTLLPILIWNLEHDWFSFRFQLSWRFIPKPDAPQLDRGYSLVKVALVWLASIAYLFPTMGIPLWWVSWRSLSQQFTAKSSQLQQKQLLILWISLPLTLGFTILGGKQQILPTWQLPGFWGLTILLGWYAQQWQKRSYLWVERWWKGTGIIVTTAFLFVLLHINLGTLQKPSQYSFFGGFLAPKNDPSVELIDLQQLGKEFAQSPLLMKALAESSFVFTNAYYLGGLIDMALRPLTSLPITCLGDDMRGFTFWFEGDRFVGKDALYITLNRFVAMSGLTQAYRTYFSSLEEIGTISITRGGVVTETFHVFQGRNFKRFVNFKPDFKNGV
jgi:4-amino-4-deoxy-L-arabinose transferase-like glycosyltransferase